MTVESKGVAELLADAAISNREIIEELGRYDAVRASFMKDVKECIKKATTDMEEVERMVNECIAQIVGHAGGEEPEAEKAAKEIVGDVGKHGEDAGEKELVEN